MSSKRRSYDTDEITLRKVFAKSSVNNSNIGALRVLTADGTGGTYWAIPSTLGYNPSFNQINTTAGNFTADLSYNIFTMSAQTGIGFSRGSGSNEVNIYGKAFNQIDVSGNNTLYGFTNGVVTPSVKFSGTGGISIRSNPQTNSIVFDAAALQVSSYLFSFQKVQVFSNASTLLDNLDNTNSIILNAASPSSILGFVGVGDIALSTNATSNTIYYSLKTSTGTISSIYASLYSLSTNLSTNYVRKSDFSTTTANLASTSFGYYSYLSSITINGLSTLSTAISRVAVNLSTTNLSTTNIFTSTITFNDITNANLQVLAVSSGILTLNGAGIQGSSGDVTKANLVSTVAGLGTAGYISTLSTNQLSTGWLRSALAEISSVNFKDLGNTNQYTLVSSNAALYFNGTLVGSGTVINNSNYSTYLYQVSSVSTLFAYADTINISSVGNAYLSPNFFSSIYFSTGDLNVSSIKFVDTATAALQSLAVTNSVLRLNTSNVVVHPNLVSTVVGLGTAGYISSAQLTSTTSGLYTYISSFVDPTELTSTVIGLGSAGFISSLGLTSILTSTVQGLGTAAYLSSPQLMSTVQGLGTAGYVSSIQLTSTIEGLGSLGYISTSQLVSTLQGLGTAGYISSAQLTSTTAGLVLPQNLTSTLIGLGTAGYISSLQLLSTVSGLGNAGFISSGQLTSTTAGLYVAIQAGGGSGISLTNLTSTVTGLGTAGYISSLQLTSSFAGLDKIAVTKIIAGTNVTISPESGIGVVTINASGSGGGGTSFAAFSTTLISSISTFVNPTTAEMIAISFDYYSQGPITISSPAKLAQMSSVQFKIDRFSSYITSSANVLVNLQYNYLFSKWQPPEWIDVLQGGTNIRNYIQPFVGFSTTLLLGATPTGYIQDTYTPIFQSNISFDYTYNDRGAPTTQTVSFEASNAYTRSQMFTLPKTSFENLYTSAFTLYHVLSYGLRAPGSNPGFPPGSNPNGYSGFSSPYVLVNIGSNTPIALYVTNSRN